MWLTTKLARKQKKNVNFIPFKCWRELVGSWQKSSTTSTTNVNNVSERHCSVTDIDFHLLTCAHCACVYPYLFKHMSIACAFRQHNCLDVSFVSESTVRPSDGNLSEPRAKIASVRAWCCQCEYVWGTWRTHWFTHTQDMEENVHTID